MHAGIGIVWLFRGSFRIINRIYLYKGFSYVEEMNGKYGEFSHILLPVFFINPVTVWYLFRAGEPIFMLALFTEAQSWDSVGQSVGFGQMHITCTHH